MEIVAGSCGLMYNEEGESPTSEADGSMLMWRVDVYVVVAACSWLVRTRLKGESGRSRGLCSMWGCGLIMLSTDWLIGTLDADWLAKPRLCQQNRCVSSDITACGGILWDSPLLSI